MMKNTNLIAYQNGLAVTLAARLFRSGKGTEVRTPTFKNAPCEYTEPFLVTNTSTPSYGMRACRFSGNDTDVYVYLIELNGSMANERLYAISDNPFVLKKSTYYSNPDAYPDNWVDTESVYDSETKLYYAEIMRASGGSTTRPVSLWSNISGSCWKKTFSSKEDPRSYLDFLCDCLYGEE